VYFRKYVKVFIDYLRKYNVKVNGGVHYDDTAV